VFHFRPSQDFIAYLCVEVRDFARTVLGKKNFFIVGEVAAPDTWIATRLSKQSSNPSNPNQHGNVPKGALLVFVFVLLIKGSIRSH
jgi:hypothetical protein